MSGDSAGPLAGPLKHRVPVGIRILVTALIVVLPLLFIFSFVILVPPSGHYDNRPTLNRYVYSWWFVFIYYLTSTLVPGMQMSYYLYPIKWYYLVPLNIPFVAAVSLVFMYLNTPPVLRFALTACALAYNFLIQLVVTIRFGCDNENVQGKHWFVAIFNSFSGFGLYYFCTIVLQSATDQTPLVQSLLSIAFQIGAYVQRAVVFRVAQLHPSHADPSRPHAGHMSVYLSHLIFFAFYRVLFDEFVDPVPFVVIQVLSVLVEFLNYVVLLMPVVMRWRDYLTALLFGCLRAVFRCCCCCWRRYPSVDQFLAKRSLVPVERLDISVNSNSSSNSSSTSELNRMPKTDSALELQQRLLEQTVAERAREAAKFDVSDVYHTASVEYMLRHLCNLISFGGYAVLAFAFNFFAYVQPHYRLLHTDTLIYVAISFGCDLLLIAIITLTWWKLFQRSLWAHWWRFLTRPRHVHLSFVLLCSCHVLLDVLTVQMIVSEDLLVT